MHRFFMDFSPSVDRFTGNLTHRQVRRCPPGYYCSRGGLNPPLACGKGVLCNESGLVTPRPVRRSGAKSDEKKKNRLSGEEKTSYDIIFEGFYWFYMVLWQETQHRSEFLDLKAKFAGTGSDKSKDQRKTTICRGCSLQTSPLAFPRLLGCICPHQALPCRLLLPGNLEGESDPRCDQSQPWWRIVSYLQFIRCCKFHGQVDFCSLFEIGDVESGLGFWLDNTSKIKNPSAQTVLTMVPLSPHCSNHTDSTKIQVIIYL